MGPVACGRDPSQMSFALATVEQDDPTCVALREVKGQTSSQGTPSYFSPRPSLIKRGVWLGLSAQRNNNIIEIGEKSPFWIHRNCGFGRISIQSRKRGEEQYQWNITGREPIVTRIDNNRQGISPTTPTTNHKVSIPQR